MRNSRNWTRRFRWPLASAWLTAGAAVAQTTTPPDNAAAADADAGQSQSRQTGQENRANGCRRHHQRRAVALTELDASPTEGAAAAGGGAAKQIVANLAPGKKATVKVAYRQLLLIRFARRLCRRIEHRLCERRFVQGQENKSRRLTPSHDLANAKRPLRIQRTARVSQRRSGRRYFVAAA